MSYFITRANFLKIVKTVELTPDQLLGSVYKSQIYCLNKLEIKLILSVKQILEDIPNKVRTFMKNGEIGDTYTYVNEYTHYSKYHSNKTCEALNSKFKDIIIPVEIKFKAGENTINYEGVKEFRDWMKTPEILDLYQNNRPKFNQKLEIRFKLQNPPNDKEKPSTGYQEMPNLTSAELEHKIDDLLLYSAEYCYANDKRAKILMGENLRLHTYWATNEKRKLMKIPQNTGYSDTIVREVLFEYHNTIKAPLINLLINYWIITLNQGLDFDKNIMEQLEFQHCSKCARLDENIIL